MSRVTPILWEEAAQAAGQAEVGQVSRHWGWEPRVAVAGDDRVDDGFEYGAGRAHGREVPEHGLERARVHGQDLVEGVAPGGPGEDAAPVALCLEAGVAGGAQRDDHISECLAHGVHSRRGRPGQVGHDGFVVSVGCVEG